ncbi:MAG TPA: glycosyltransferase family 4 protein [Pyrinomonadaceae bacterium]|nr:glycosyltransferase family 4 protein [Pyrinomonadaceae bacterium]
MTKVAILTSSITTGDAVSNDVFGMMRALEKRRHEVRIYAEGWTFEEPRVWLASKIAQFIRSPDDVLIYHYSVGWEVGLELLRELPCRTVVKYHNVTPPEFFVGFSEPHVYMSRSGRRQLKDIAHAACDVYLADSPYNARELRAEGVAAERLSVVPPFHHIDRLRSGPTDPEVLNALRDGKTNVLMVGRVSPNKGHVALIEAFANYYYNYNSHSRLLIVGREDRGFSTYSSLLREIVARLKLRDAVVFTGAVSEAALKSYYLASHVFVTASEHEGFCVPLVEAMAMNVPIVAYSSSAIPETVGDAGLVWRERDSLLLAESINTLVKDEAIATALARTGQRRYEQFFTNDRIEAEFVKAVESLL